MRQALAVLALAVFTDISRLEAQTTEATTRALAHLQAQLDQMQAPAAATVRLYGHTDAAALVGTVLFVGGWFFDCDSGSADVVELEIDGVIRPEAMLYARARIERPDVAAAYAGLCPKVPQASGALLFLDLSAYATLLPHTVVLRGRNQQGIGKRFNGLFIFDCGGGQVCVQPEGSPRAVR